MSRAGAALNTANYYPTTSNVSADFTVDDTCAVQYNGDIKNRYCWHCGGSKYATKGGSLYGKCTNANSIGVEICSMNSTGKMQNANDRSYSFTEAAVNNAVELVKQLMKWYNIPPENVIRHYDVTGKPCPGIIGWNKESGSEAEWNKFKARIFEGSALPAKKMYYVQVGAFSSKTNAEKYLESVKKKYPNAFIKVI
jgi:N-acetylmuramoyl-L-alanine amidase CwlA